MRNLRQDTDSMAAGEFSERGFDSLVFATQATYESGVKKFGGISVAGSSLPLRDALANRGQSAPGSTPQAGA